jgi:hypothetical protein
MNESESDCIEQKCFPTGRRGVMAVWYIFVCLTTEERSCEEFSSWFMPMTPTRSSIAVNITNTNNNHY